MSEEATERDLGEEMVDSLLGVVDTHGVSKRLQVLFDEEEFDEIRELAARKRMTVAEWVRQSLRDARADEPKRDVDAKLAVLEKASRFEFPTGEIEQILSEIDTGYAPDDEN